MRACEVCEAACVLGRACRHCGWWNPHEGAPHPSKLACTRCGAPVTRSEQPGRCFNEQCEPAEHDEHDDAEPWALVHGGTPAEVAEAEAWLAAHQPRAAPRLFVHGVTAEQWTKRHGVVPFTSTCSECGRPATADQPFVQKLDDAHTLHGLAAPPCACGNERTPYALLLEELPA